MATNAPTKTNGKAEAPSRVPAGVLQQLAFSGTPRTKAGEIQPDDYVTELTNPLKRMALFEEMRAADGSVNTAIAAREQLIYSANWLLSTEDESDTGVQILEFLEDNIYPIIEDLLRHLAGAIQYGFSMVEPVFEWADRPFARNVVRPQAKVRRTTKAGERMIYLRRIAHIRQRTVNTFIVSDKGDIESVVQYVWTGRSFQKINIPPEKVLIWSYNRQGDDFWGVPPTRNAYKAWRFKAQIEKLNLLGMDRFGTGTPVASGGPDWTDAEYLSAHTYLQNWRAGTNGALVVPSGGSVSLVSGDGSLILALKDVAGWYGLEIAKTYLTQGTELGSTETGARALGEVFFEQTESIVQADCEAIASIVNEQLIVPLVEWNFGPQEVYPVFEPSQRVRASSAIVSVLVPLIHAKAIQVEPGDEQWIRDALGLPPIDVEARQAEMDEQKARNIALQEQLAGKSDTDPAAKDGDDAKTPAARAALIAASRIAALAAQRPRALSAPEMPAQSYRTREFSEFEARVLKPEILVRDLDLEAIRLTAEVREALEDIDAELARQVEELAMSGATSLANAPRAVTVPERLRTRLRKVMREAAARARAYGSAAVKSEVARQSEPENLPARQPNALSQLITAITKVAASQAESPPITVNTPPVTLNLTVESPKAGTRKVVQFTRDAEGKMVSADVTETEG